jgi:hypothetical protein
MFAGSSVTAMLEKTRPSGSSAVGRDHKVYVADVLIYSISAVLGIVLFLLLAPALLLAVLGRLLLHKYPKYHGLYATALILMTILFTFVVAVLSIHFLYYF